MHFAPFFGSSTQYCPAAWRNCASALPALTAAAPVEIAAQRTIDAVADILGDDKAG